MPLRIGHQLSLVGVSASMTLCPADRQSAARPQTTHAYIDGRHHHRTSIRPTLTTTQSLHAITVCRGRLALAVPTTYDDRRNVNVLCHKQSPGKNSGRRKPSKKSTSRWDLDKRIQISKSVTRDASTPSADYRCKRLVIATRHANADMLKMLSHILTTEIMSHFCHYGHDDWLADHPDFTTYFGLTTSLFRISISDKTTKAAMMSAFSGQTKLIKTLLNHRRRLLYMWEFI